MTCKIVFLSIGRDINSSISIPASFTMLVALLKYVMLFWKLKPRNIIFEIKTIYSLQLSMYHDVGQKVLNILCGAEGANYCSLGQGKPNEKLSKVDCVLYPKCTTFN